MLFFKSEAVASKAKYIIGQGLHIFFNSMIFSCRKFKMPNYTTKKGSNYYENRQLIGLASALPATRATNIQKAAHENAQRH
jgi:hypothetical protein